MTFEEPPTGLIPWFSKTEGNTYATIAASPSPLRGKPTQAQDVAATFCVYGKDTLYIVRVIGKERANKTARVKWGRGKREANGK